MIASVDTYRKILFLKEKRWNKEGILSAFSQSLISEFGKDNMLAELNQGKEKEFNFRLPDMIVSGSLNFNLGKCNSSYRSITSCHCPGQYVLYVEEDKILFIGDILWPNMDADESLWFYDYEVFKKMREELLSYDAEFYIESHAKPISRNDLGLWLKKIIFLMEAVKFKKLSIEESIKKLPENFKEIDFGYDDLILGAIGNCR